MNESGSPVPPGIFGVGATEVDNEETEFLCVDRREEMKSFSVMPQRPCAVRVSILALSSCLLVNSATEKEYSPSTASLYASMILRI